MDVDSAAKQVYWADKVALAVLRVNLDGTNVEYLKTGISENQVPENNNSEFYCAFLISPSLVVLCNGLSQQH